MSDKFDNECKSKQMKLKSIGSNYSPISKLMVAIGVLFISMLVFSYLNYGIDYVFYGVTPTQLPLLLEYLGTDRTIELAKVIQIFSSIGFFIVPAILLAYLFSDFAVGY